MAPGDVMSAGLWTVLPGREDAFVAAWENLARWTLTTFPTARQGNLIRSNDEPNRFISFGGWENVGAIAEWRAHPEFAQKMGALRELCERIEAGNYTVAAETG